MSVIRQLIDLLFITSNYTVNKAFFIVVFYENKNNSFTI
uniref:Uncharacterized protein n=1 Tax=Caloglossa intermedia TaxID=100879 RepID=A0A1Z1M6Q3_9FLOR|nr:hypothetical protein [Caloglossa intermedia]ARW61434.1 hypothetical protein [Caloglossa intermedia]